MNRPVLSIQRVFEQIETENGRDAAERALSMVHDYEIADADDDPHDPDIRTLADYRERVTTMADMIEQYVEEDPALDLHDAVWEELDSSRVAIYTHEAIAALRFAENDPQEWRHLVAEDEDDWRKVVVVMAYTAVEADLYDELRKRGVEA